MAYHQLTAAQEARFPDDGYPWQVETLGTQTDTPDHYGMGGETYEVWIAVYQNYSDPARREIVYTGNSVQEVLDWINNP